MRRRQTRPFDPFPKADDLIQVGFSYTEEGDLDFDRDSYLLEPEQFLDGITPRFGISLDPADVASHLGVSDSDVNGAIIFRDPRAKLYNRLDSWPLCGIPDSWVYSGRPLKSAGSCSLSFCLILNKEVAPFPGRPSRAGAVLAERRIDLTTDAFNPSLSFKRVPPDAFVKHGLPADTLWRVNFLSDDLEQPVDAVLEIWINERAFPKLAAAQNSAAGEVLLSILGAEIYATIGFEAVLRSSASPEKDAGLLADVVGRLGKEMNVGYDGLKSAAKDGNFELFRSYAQSLLKAVSAVERSSFRSK